METKKIITFEEQFTEDIKLLHSFVSTKKSEVNLIRLKSANNKLTASAFDTAIYVTAILPNKTEGVFDITLNREHFVKIMECAGKEGTIEILKDKIEVKGDTIHSMPYSTGEDFIEAEEVNSKEKITFNENQLTEISRVSFAVSKEREQLKGICLNENSVIGTDGYRLAKSDFKHPLNDTVLTRDFVNAIAGFEYVDLYFDNTNGKVKAVSSNITVITDYTTGYPNYKGILPEKLGSDFTANRQDLINTVNSVLNSTEQTNRKVILEINGNNLEVTAENPETRYISKAAISVTASDYLKTAVNGSYFLDILKSSKDEKILIEYLSNNNYKEDTPANQKTLVLKSQKYLSLLMPVALNGKKSGKKEKKEKVKKSETPTEENTTENNEVSKDIVINATENAEATA